MKKSHFNTFSLLFFFLSKSLCETKVFGRDITPQKTLVSYIPHRFETIAEKAADSVNWTINILQSLIDETNLDLERFTQIKLMVEDELGQADALLDKVQKNSDTHLLYQFAKHIYSVMNMNSEILGVYGPTDNIHIHWVSCLLQLGMKLLQLPPNPEMNRDVLEDCTNAVALHYSYISFWHEMSKYVKGVPVTVRVMVRGQMRESELVFYKMTGAGIPEVNKSSGLKYDSAFHDFRSKNATHRGE